MARGDGPATNRAPESSLRRAGYGHGRAIMPPAPTGPETFAPEGPATGGGPLGVVASRAQGLADRVFGIAEQAEELERTLLGIRPRPEAVAKEAPPAPDTYADRVAYDLVNIDRSVDRIIAVLNRIREAL